MRSQAFFSSRSLHRMNSSTSGWSTLRMTIFAARRVLPPDLIAPAKLSKPFMKETGPDAMPPEESDSVDERSEERFEPVPDPNLKSMPSVLARSRIEDIESPTELMKHADAGDRVRDAADELFDRPLALRRPRLSVKVLLRDDVRRRHRPGFRDLDVL